MRKILKYNILLIITYILIVNIIFTNNIFFHEKTNEKINYVKLYLENSETSEYKKSELIIKLKEDKFDNLKELEETYNLKIKKIIGKYIHVEFNDQITTKDILINLKNNKNIEYAEPNYLIETTTTPNQEPGYNQMWHFTSSNGINIQNTWQETYGNEEVIVGIIDTGVDYNHPDLINNVWINNEETMNGLDDDNNGYIDDIHGWDFYNNNNNVIDTEGHGTHIAGTIAASINSYGIVGIAPNIKFMPLKTENGQGELSLVAIVEAINYAREKGVKVFNLSFGTYSYYKALEDIIKETDALFIAAAGNDEKNIDIYPFYPASYDSNNILVVAATNQQGNLANFSNYGINTVDVAAPGEMIYSTFKNNLFGFMSGTSMAAPMVVGQAALLYSYNYEVNSSFNYEYIKNAIINNVTNKSSLNDKIISKGIINVDNSYNYYKTNILFSGGEGTIENPYIISNPKDLYDIRNYETAYFILSNDINLYYDTTNEQGLYYNNNKGWDPIETFKGNIDGKNFSIINININREDQDYIGIFADTENAIIKNLNIKNINIKGKNYVGGLSGYSLNSNIEYITTSGSIVSNNYTGGITGHFEGNINKSYSEININSNDYTGGIVGYLKGNINNVFSLGSIESNNYSAGIAGYLKEGQINNTYYMGTLLKGTSMILNYKEAGDINNNYYNNYLNLDTNEYGEEINIFNKEEFINFDFENTWEFNNFPTLKNVEFNPIQNFNILNFDIYLNQIYNLSLVRKNYTYKSLDENILTIDKYGVITGKKLGQTKIEIYSAELDLTKQVTINVKSNLKGDLNGDGLVTTTDLIILRRYLAGLQAIPSEFNTNADINNDSQITTTDLVRLRRYLAGLEEL